MKLRFATTEDGHDEAKLALAQEHPDHRVGEGVNTLVLDKNVIELLAAEQDEEQVRLLNRLIDKFQIVIPYILIEETLGNHRFKGTRTEVPKKIMPILTQLRSCWREEDLEQVFHELVVAKATPQNLTALPVEFADALLV